MPQDFDFRIFSWISFPQAGVVDTDGKFTASVVETSGKLPPVSLTAQANLLPVSFTPVTNLPPVLTTPALQVAKFFRLSPQIFEKIWNDPHIIFNGLVEDDSWKKPEAKNLVTLSLKAGRIYFYQYVSDIIIAIVKIFTYLYSVPADE